MSGQDNLKHGKVEVAPQPSSSSSRARPASAGRRTAPSLDLFVARLTEAADDGDAHIFAEAERCFSEMTGAAATIIVNSAGQWRHWQDLAQPAEDIATLTISDSLLESRAMVPIRAQTVAVLLENAGGASLKTSLNVLAACVGMALEVSTGHAVKVRSVSELEVMRAVAARILETQDLDEILLLVSHETRRLLDADICGVLLREDDEVAMKSCVGHFSSTMPRLRMQSGVGVAGQVLATGEPFLVSNYVESEEITRDFVPLARVEKVRSALAAPILSRNAIIGVLEVWRRRPQPFTTGDAPLLMALAGLASIAIDNALLLRAHADSAARLSAAYQELEERYAVITSVGSFQEQVAGLMLVDKSLPRIIELTAEFTDAAILFLDADRHVECVAPTSATPSDEEFRLLEQHLSRSRRLGDVPFSVQLDKKMAYILPVTSGVEPLGWLIWLGTQDPGERTRLALRHVSMAAGLYCFERRRVARQRLSTLENVLWGLLSADLPERTLAYDRARELRVFSREKVFMAVISLPIGEADLDPVRHERILSAMEQDAVVVVAGIRGNQLCLLCKGMPDAPQASALNAIRERLKNEWHTGPVPMGLSGSHSDWRTLPSAFREAVIALEVARHRRQNPVASYDNIGIMGLLLNLRDKADLRRVVEEILGSLLLEAEPGRGVLLATLRAFFESDCSHAAAAARLNVHSKTIAYRLEKIGNLTGLSFSRHQDRVLADIGIRLVSLLEEDL